MNTTASVPAPVLFPVKTVISYGITKKKNGLSFPTQWNLFLYLPLDFLITSDGIKSSSILRSPSFVSNQR
jgi:hypothetical protein